MAPLTAQSALALQLEDVNDQIPLVLEQTSEVDRYINERASAKRVSLRNFRIRMQFATSGAVSKGNLETGALPSGTGNQYDQGVVTPVIIFKPVQYSRLADLTGEPTDVATQNPVTQTLAQLARDIAKNRDVFLQGNGDGRIATVDASYVAGNNPIILANGAGNWGARNCFIGQKVQVMTPAYVLRGSLNIQDVAKDLGGTQSITPDGVPPGTQAGDFIMVDAVEQVAPVFINGIPYFHSTSAVGNVLGISKSKSYVVANGLSINNGQISLPALELSGNKIVQSLGPMGLKKQKWHTHPSQQQAFKELAFNQIYYPLSGGKASEYDPMIGVTKVDGRDIILNIHADQTRWDLMNFESWGKVKFGNPPFWFKNRSGQWVFQVYDTASGNPTVQELCVYVDAVQYYVDNFKAITSVTSAKVPPQN